jgi:hypothetical protein
MKNVTTSMIAAAAVAGLFAGASAVRASSTVSSGRTVTTTSRATGVAANFAGHKATNLDDAAGKHDCKGKNDCKGAGGCKTGDNGCKGKNTCKGKGGCSTNSTSEPAKV